MERELLMLKLKDLTTLLRLSKEHHMDMLISNDLGTESYIF